MEISDPVGTEGAYTAQVPVSVSPDGSVLVNPVVPGGPGGPGSPCSPLHAVVVFAPTVNFEPPSVQPSSSGLSDVLSTLAPSLPFVPLVPGAPFSPLGPL